MITRNPRLLFAECLQQCGRSPTPAPERSARDKPARAVTRQAILELFTPDQPRLRVPAETATDAFLAMFYGRGRPPHQDEQIPTDDLVDLFLHGALNTPEPA